MAQSTPNTMRFNITLPADIGKKVKASKNHSALIAESLRQKFALEEKEQLVVTLTEGYKARAESDKKLAKEFEQTYQDGL